MAIDPSKMTRKLVSLPHEMVEAISEYRFAEKIGTESEAIRRLIQKGLEDGKISESEE